MFRKKQSKESSSRKQAKATPSEQPSTKAPPPEQDWSTAQAPPSDAGENTKQQQEQQGVIDQLREQVAFEKKGKQKLYHSLLKLAQELKRVRTESSPLQQQAAFANQAWYSGGLWRAPTVLPGVHQQHRPQQAISRLRGAISLSDLFFNLVIVTAFTRVGVSITQTGRLDRNSMLYFAVFWSIWSKEASYSTRFDTSDLSAKAEVLLTSFAVLFASLSVSGPMDSIAGSRVMLMAGFCALLHFGLMARVYLWHRAAVAGSLEYQVQQYALFNVILLLLEAVIWIGGLILVPEEWSYRWVLFLGGVLCALRIPRSFMANDFHAATSKRGILFILLLGFMLQSVVVVATEFFEYDTPNLEEYSFLGASCLLLFCIKLLYVDDSSTLASDHALLVNRTAAFFFNIGQFALLLATTVMGSGLTLLTHSYLAAAAALPDNAKNLVCGGFSAVLLSTLFIKSLHVKRVPLEGAPRALFIAAYVIQTICTIGVAGVTAAMCFGQAGYFQILLQNDVELLWVLCGFAVFLVLLGWTDEGLELALGNEYENSEFLVHPFGFWWCLQAETEEPAAQQTENTDFLRHPRGLSEMSPLLGESVVNMRMSGTFLSQYAE